MQVTDTILSILQSMTTGSDPELKTVLYSTPWDTNVRLDRLPDPAAILYMLNSYTVDTSTMMKRASVDVEVFFCKRFTFDAKGEVIKGVMDSIEPIVDDFISLLLDERSFVVSDINASTAYGRFDANVCGYSLQFTVTEKQGSCL